MFGVTLHVQNVNELFGMPLQVKFDPKVLRFVNARAGQFLGKGGEPPTMNNVVREDGMIFTNLMRSPNADGVTGSGDVVSYTFEAVQSGPTAIEIQSGSLFPKGGSPKAYTASTVNVAIKP
jgi:general secretion pathway protein D